MIDVAETAAVRLTVPAVPPNTATLELLQTPKVTVSEPLRQKLEEVFQFPVPPVPAVPAF